MKPFEYTAIALFYLAALLSVGVSAWIPGREALLGELTAENGFYETLSVVLLLLISLQGFIALKRLQGSLVRFGVVLLAVVAFLAAMEEISWGQQWFHFESSEYFLEHNEQRETNLHNLMNPELFSSLIYSSVYTFFLFVPLFVRLLAPRWRYLARLEPWLPSLHVSLVILFASLFQAYFYDNFGAWLDLGTLLAAEVLFAFVLTSCHLWNRALMIHFTAILVSMGFFMLSYHIFGFYNMQYEMREMFVVAGVLFYLREQIARHTLAH